MRNQNKKIVIRNVSGPPTLDDAVGRAVNGAKKVNLRPLKRYVAKLPRSPFQELILNDLNNTVELDFREFLGRLHVWLQLLHRSELPGFEGRDRVDPRGVGHGE